MKTKSYIILTLILMIMPFLSTNGTNSLDKFIYNEIEETIIHADTYGMQKHITYLKKILEQTPDNDVNDKITINESIGFLYLHLGNSQASIKIFKSNLKILQATYPEEYGKHMISVLGIMLSSSNHITDYKQFMEYMVKYDNSPYYHLMFGLLSTEAKDFKSALEHFQTGLNLCENKNSIETKWIRMFSLIIKEQIVKLNIELGEYEKSLECIKKFRQEIDDDFEQDTYYGYILDMNMATIYRLLGNHDKARYYINSIEQSLQTKGESETYLNGKTLELKGDICFHEKDFESAYQLYYNSEQIYGHIGTEIIPTVIKELECMYKIRNDDESRKIEQRLEKWFDKNWNITYYINYLYVTGGFWSKSIMNSMAIDCLKGGMELIETIHGDYDEILKFQNSLGGAYFYSGDYMSAVNLYTDIIENERKRAKNLFAYLTESQRELYWKNRESLMNNIFMLNREGTITISRGTVFVDRKNNKNISSELLYDASLLNKGLLLETFINMHRAIMSSQDEELIEAFNEMRKINGRDSDRAEQLENIIRSKISDYEDYMDFTEITWKDIRDNLKQDEVAIEFIVSEEDGVEYYSAEVLKSGYKSPQHVFLFARTIEDNSIFGMEPYKETRFYEKTWGKLSCHIKGCSDIYFSPAGILYGIAMEHLPMNDSTYMNDVYCLHRLSSTKSIARRETQNISEIMKSAVLYGGLDYNLDQESMEYYAQTMQEYSRGTHNRSLSNSISIDNMNWKYLYGTEKEVKNIFNILENQSCITGLYTGEKGIEESFKILNGQSPKIIHIATHGFYFKQSYDMLVGTGLVFAGANNYNSTISSNSKMIEDGLLTSKEISEMNLNGTELVVLSACQTGLGEISQEGVFGLQRGFKKACAKALLMSLWEVDDEATNILMTNFYYNLSNGVNKHQALHLAQKNVKEKYGDNPDLWAGFILLD